MKKSIKINDKFGYWQVVEIVNKRYLICLCTGCNQTKKKIWKWHLTGGKTRSCGCKKFELLKQTNQRKYSVDFPLQNPEIKKKADQTIFKKYKVSNIMKLAEIVEKARIKKLLNKAKKRGGLLLGYSKFGNKKDSSKSKS